MCALCILYVILTHQLLLSVTHTLLVNIALWVCVHARGLQYITYNLYLRTISLTYQTTTNTVHMTDTVNLNAVQLYI